MSVVSAEKSAVPSPSGLSVARDLAHLEAAERLQPLLQLGDGARRLLGAVAEALAGAFVDDQRDDAGQALALLALQHRVGERQHEQRRGERPPCHAAHALPGEHRDDDKQQAAERGDQRPGQDRLEGEVQARHWPSLSSSAGTCTWSAL